MGMKRKAVACAAGCLLLWLLASAPSPFSIPNPESSSAVLTIAGQPSSAQVQVAPEEVRPVTGSFRREVRLLDAEGWKFLNVGNPRNTDCSDANFPEDLADVQCEGLLPQAQVANRDACQATCCQDSFCEVWQWCPKGAAGCQVETCWTGRRGSCRRTAGSGWVSRARDVPRVVPSAPGQTCESEYCKAKFDDSKWRDVELPHDMLLHNGFSRQHADMVHGFVPYSVGWYRLRFKVPLSSQGRALRLDFDGVQRDSAVYLNGKLLGTHASGFTPFSFDVSEFVVYGKEAANVLSVKVDATQPTGWWYDGGGIYRHVWLTTMHRVHIDKWGVYLPALVVSDISRDGTTADAQVKSETTLRNLGAEAAGVLLSHTIFNAAGDVVVSQKMSVAVASHGTAKAAMEMSIPRAKLWSDTVPYLYSCKTQLKGSDDSVIDEVTNTFGVRKMEWDADRGFILNGRPKKIKGFANHQDFAGVGVAIPDDMQGFRVYMHKLMGANGWRTAHNPPTEALLNECDAQGVLVQAENHRNEVTDDKLQDLESMILRDRNHPSVFMWSLCNEVLCGGFNPKAARILKPMFKELDPYGQRPVTAAMNIDPMWPKKQSQEFQSILDVMGLNYHHDGYDRNHEMHPEQPMIGSETSSDFSDRSIYFNDEKSKKYVSAYDVNFPQWGATAEDAWCAIADRDFVAGGFYWTGFDYKGEPTPYGWPNVNSHFGVIDIAGFPKDNFFYHKSVFISADTQPILHILPHWNWDKLPCLNNATCNYDQKGKRIIDVWAYTNAASVELWLNDASLGRKEMVACRHVSWWVPFQPGRLRAVSYDDHGKKVASVAVSTTGAAVRIALSIDWPLNRAPVSGDTVLVRAALQDADGMLVPTASAPLRFTVTGGAHIIGLGNGDPSCQEPDLPASAVSGARSAWNGLARVILRVKSAKFSLTATGPHLQSGVLKQGATSH